MAQPIQDNAVIPVSVTLNSILRLTVVTGGNIEFVVNTIDQYTSGIVTGARYTTNFTVSSSVDFDVEMSTEDATFLGTDNPTSTLPLNNVGYTVVANAAASGADPGNWALSTITGLSQAANKIVTGVVNASAGSADQNNFDIQWEMGTSAGGGMNAQSLLQQSISPDRYVTSVYLQLIGK